jgi:uncharacterized coiled-coil protein SlyX
MHVTKTSETQSQTEQPESTAPSRRSSLKSILALSVFALGLNATAAVHTLSPSDFALPNVSLAELLPHQKTSDPTPDQPFAVALLPSFDIPLPNFSTEQLSEPKASAPLPNPVVAALKDIQSAQQQRDVSLQANSSLLQQNTALLQQDSMALASLRQSVTDEHVDVKKISTQITDEHADVKKMSAQISTLIAKVDSLQNAISPDVTSSIPTRHARHRLSGVARKRMARQPKSVGPVSVGGAPLGIPTLAPQG